MMAHTPINSMSGRYTCGLMTVSTQTSDSAVSRKQKTLDTSQGWKPGSKPVRG
jgi:hypothetical protein